MGECKGQVIDMLNSHSLVFFRSSEACVIKHHGLCPWVSNHGPHGLHWVVISSARTFSLAIMICVNCGQYRKPWTTLQQIPLGGLFSFGRAMQSSEFSRRTVCGPDFQNWSSYDPRLMMKRGKSSWFLRFPLGSALLGGDRSQTFISLTRPT